MKITEPLQEFLKFYSACPSKISIFSTEFPVDAFFKIYFMYIDFSRFEYVTLKVTLKYIF